MARVAVVKTKEVSPLHRLVEDYLMDCRARGLAPATVNGSYGYPLRSVFLPWCDENAIERPDQLDTRTVNAFSVALAERGGKNREQLSKFSSHAYARSVRGFLNWCAREGEAITARPALPRLPRRVLDVLDRAEIDALEAAAPSERDKLIIRVLGDCGLRAEGLCGLRLDDVVRRDRQAYLRVSEKSDKEREVPISPTLLRRLERYMANGRPKGAPGTHLFVSLRRGLSGDYEPLTRSGVLKLVRGAAERAGIKKRVHTHLLRHSFITNALRAGMNPIILAKISGHSSLRMIDQVYSHLNTSDSYEAMIRMLNETGSRR
ncbi:MAG: tyrosine-type recombinase/integrase [Candidatus Dormibacteria bacterium]